MAKPETTPLTQAQREIMEIVWDQEVTVTQVRDQLAERREVARNTIQTMIVRLEERGWLKHRTEGRTFWYSANRPRTASLGAKVAQMVDRLFAGSPEEMVTALMEYRGLTADEADRIREMIDAAETTAPKQSKRKAAKNVEASHEHHVRSMDRLGGQRLDPFHGVDRLVADGRGGLPASRRTQQRGRGTFS